MPHGQGFFQGNIVNIVNIVKIEFSFPSRPGSGRGQELGDLEGAQ